MCFQRPGAGGKGNVFACPKNAGKPNNEFPFWCFVFTSLHLHFTILLPNIQSFISLATLQYINYLLSQPSLTASTMLVSKPRLAVLALTGFAPIAAQAVQLTNNAYTGITAGSPFTLTWSGDGSVRSASCYSHPASPLRTHQHTSRLS